MQNPARLTPQNSGGESVMSAMSRKERRNLIRIAVALGLFAAVFTADKIVGRAAAFLYVKLGAAGVYAPVMSRGAKELLTEYNIPAEADELTENIRNRQNTGLCPMECAVSSCGSPEAAYAAILEAIRKMQQK